MGANVSNSFGGRRQQRRVRSDQQASSSSLSSRRTSQSSSSISHFASGVMSAFGSRVDRSENGNEYETSGGERNSLTSNADLSGVLQYLIRRGHIRLVYDVYVDDSDDEDMYRHSMRSTQRNRSYVPSGDPMPDTSIIDQSDFKQITQLQSGLGNKSSEKVPSIMATLRDREYGLLGSKVGGRSSLCLQNSGKCVFGGIFLPNKLSTIEQYPSKAFCGFFAKDGMSFLTACQDCIIRLYDTRRGKFHLRKTVWARDVGWSILDTDISPDGEHFIYSSWSECIHICNVYGQNEAHEALPLNPTERRFCLFSLRFSLDGKEILGGANDECLYIYDLQLNSRVLRIKSHDDDVNSVTFADQSSQILFSAGDDGLCKVWDRRTLSESNPRAVGIFAGHSDGITYIDSKEDGRHLITNCKDQTIKLWDMRSFSPMHGADATRKAVSKQNWDYRWQAVPRKLYSNRKKLEGDTSLMTYRGHSVQQTLIRCRFSPAFTTGQRFIYTGCASGRVVIFDALTGTIVKTLSGHRACVRDVSWHPMSPQLISTSWDGSICEWSYIDETLRSEIEDSNGVQLPKAKRTVTSQSFE
ncbi:DDB1- and CUL4-associated factor 11-like isoform X2 [Dinothrombium tinctorium]|uniref:DDB1-and CUL4-associated factor 11-like isoform X2 n=1 Tax=Dinothrombium tinctorium TaxID=1965070 RepID=A0A443RKM2_9ACAR|nr:DDB1- and CUL4-associated factor 11-like isoform X2 [Dinothrombium tinctorium]